MRSYARICESCGKELVEVDNPIRREIRHRRGEEVSCPAWREAAGLPPLSHRAPIDELADLAFGPLRPQA